MKVYYPMVYAALLLAACNAGRQSDVAEKENENPTAVQGIEVGGGMMIDTHSIAENLLNSNDHTTFTKAAAAAGFLQTLSGPGPFTVLAPTNEAFNKLPAGMIDDLLLPGHKKTLANILNYHIIHGAFKTSDLTEGMELKTIQGETLKIAQQNGQWRFNNATVTIPDVLSENGIVFVIDAVLLPADK